MFSYYQNKTRNLCHFDFFQSLHPEESWYLFLLNLDTMTSRHVMKAVVCMAEWIAAHVLIHGLLTFLWLCNMNLFSSKEFKPNGPIC